MDFNLGFGPFGSLLLFWLLIIALLSGPHVLMINGLECQICAGYQESTSINIYGCSSMKEGNPTISCNSKQDYLYASLTLTEFLDMYNMSDPDPQAQTAPPPPDEQDEGQGNYVCVQAFRVVDGIRTRFTRSCKTSRPGMPPRKEPYLSEGAEVFICDETNVEKSCLKFPDPDLENDETAASSTWVVRSTGALLLVIFSFVLALAKVSSTY